MPLDDTLSMWHELDDFLITGICSFCKDNNFLKCFSKCFCLITEIHACMYKYNWQNESEVTQSCPTLCEPMDCSLPGSSVHGVFQARVLEWVAISLSRASSRPRDWTWVSCTVGRCFTIWATREDTHTHTHTHNSIGLLFCHWHNDDNYLSLCPYTHI